MTPEVGVEAESPLMEERVRDGRSDRVILRFGGRELQLLLLPGRERTGALDRNVSMRVLVGSS